MSEKIYYEEYPLTIAGREYVVFFGGGLLRDGVYRSGKHIHEYTEIIYCFKGKVEISYENTKEILSEGDTAVIPKNVFHSLKNMEDQGFIALGCRGLDCKEITIVKKFAADSAFRRFVGYYLSSHICKTDLIKSCLTEIIALIIENGKEGLREKKRTITLESNDFRRYIIDNYIQSEFTKSITLKELAKLVNLSIQQTGRIVREMYNMSFSELIIFLKINRAKSYLREKILNISEISSELGYSNPHNFYEQFKNQTGMTPGNYRKMFWLTQ